MPESYSIVLEPSLRELLRLQSKGKMRRAWKRLTSRRRIIPTTLVAVFILLHVVQVYIALAYSDMESTVGIEAIAPIGLFGILCMKLLGLCIDRKKSGSCFRKEELHRLVGGPYSLQQVRLYRVSGHAISIFFTSVVAAIFFRFHVPSYVAALGGSYLAMVFTYLVYTAIAVSSAHLPETTYKRTRNVICGLGVAVLGYILFRAAGQNVSNVDFLKAIGKEAIAISQTIGGQTILFPFVVFTRVIASHSLWHGCSWLGLGLILNYAALQLLLRAEVRLDRWARQRERIQLTGMVAATGGSRASQSVDHGARVGARIPWVGGIGPIIWRQIRALARLRGGLGWLLVPMAFAFAAGGYFAYDPEEGALQTIAMVVVLTSVFLPGLLPFDFRGDLQAMAALKTMPLKPTHIVLGQLTVPALLLTFFQLMSLCVLLIHDAALWSSILLTMCFLLPTNVVIIALENTIFLLYPYRITEFDMQATVRRVVMLMAKFCVLFVAAVASTLVGLLVIGLKLLAQQHAGLNAAFSEISMPLMIVTQLVALTGLAILMVKGTTWAFHRLDLSEDLPA